MTRQLPAIEVGGRFLRNMQRTTPLLPCARHTLPQIARNLVPLISVFAL